MSTLSKSTDLKPQKSDQQHKLNINNFDLIRLFAATQVAVSHTAQHLKVEFDWLRIFSYFPGVPIFFFISGYLIYESYSSIPNDKLKVFVTNRFLRLYPALYLCFGLTLISIYLFERIL